MDAATHPGTRQFYSRALVSHMDYKEVDADASRSVLTVNLSYGIRSDLALMFEQEFAHLSNDDRDRTGFRLTTFQLKQRLMRRDLSPLNTWRVSFLGGIAVPGGLDDSLPGQAYPRASLVTTAILGRHGLNGEVKWEEYGSKPSRSAVNGAHLYRVLPAEYGEATKGAWYTMIESLNGFTDEGDFRFDVAPGILYEARRWAWELSLRVPLRQDWPQETNYEVTMGFRMLL